MHSQKSATSTTAKVRTLQIAVFTHPSAAKVSAGTKQANSIKILSVDSFEVTHPEKELKAFLLLFYFFQQTKWFPLNGFIVDSPILFPALSG